MKNFFRLFIKSCPKTGMFKGFKPVKGFDNLLWPLIGFAALLWILIRVIPKPGRIQYPCMRAAAPFAGTFLMYIAGLAAAVFSFRKAKDFFARSKVFTAVLFILTGLTVSTFTIFKTEKDTYANISADTVFIPADPPNTPMGTARGIFPGRVVWAWDSSAADWNGISGRWWNNSSNNQESVDSMLSRSLQALSGTTSDSAAWDNLFKYFNENNNKGRVGYQTGEKIAVKINLNQSSGAGDPGNASFTSPHVVLALIRQLVYKAGVPDSCITFYDLIRYVPDPIYSLCKSEFPGVHFMGWNEGNGREKYLRDTTRIYWSETLSLEKDNQVSGQGGNPVYLPTTVAQASYLINLASFKAHRYGGVTFGAKNHFGTLSVDDDSGNPYVYAPHAAGIHAYMAVRDFIIEGSPEWSFLGRPMGSYSTLVDLMGHRDLGEKTMLFMIDALYGVQSEQDQVSLNSRWLSAPFNNRWTSSLFIAQDDVALESVALDFFRNEQGINSNIIYVTGTVDNYLHEASMADNPPSGTFYNPNGDSVRLQSLGVHEHWNNGDERQYTRNLGNGGGIELVSIFPSITSAEDYPIPSEFVLHQNFPNPFNPGTVIKYSIQKPGHVLIRIFDALGKEVDMLVNENKMQGSYEVSFNRKDLSSGVYYYRIEIDGLQETKKMLMLK